MADTTQDLMRKRFAEATAEAAVIRAKADPIRTRRDDLAKQVQAIEKQMADLAAQVREIEKPLYDLENERGMLNRALNGKTA